MSLTPQEIKDIVVALQDSQWDQATVTVGDVRIAVGRNGATPDAQPASAAPAVAAVIPPVAPSPGAPNHAPAADPAPTTADTSGASGYVVTAPSVGVFWKTPQPGQPPFVEIGSTVEAGDTLCIVEVMKLMNNVTADVAGTIAAVHVENAVQVEYGTPLFTITPREQ